MATNNDYFIQSGTLIQQVSHDVFMAQWRLHNVPIEIQDEFFILTIDDTTTESSEYDHYFG